MKKIMLLLIALILCAVSPLSIAERHALSQQEAVALMDAMSEYLSLDIRNLKECALDFRGIEVTREALICSFRQGRRSDKGTLQFGSQILRNF